MKMLRLPQQHIADSVAQRLLAFMRAQAQGQTTNSVQAQGARIDAALAQPVADVAAPEGVEDGVVFRALDL